MQVPLQAFIREAPLKSLDDDAHLRLDYLGYLTPSGHPLLVVEAKRPSISAPEARFKRECKVSMGSPALDCGSFVKTLANPSNPITEGWKRFLQKGRKYVEAVRKDFGQAPQRFVFTNGSWFVVFKDPDKAFLDGANAKASDIIVFLDRNEVLSRSREFFELLNFHSLLPPFSAIKASALQPPQREGRDLRLSGTARELPGHGADRRAATAVRPRPARAFPGTPIGEAHSGRGIKFGLGEF